MSEVLGRFRPTHIVRSIEGVTPEALEASGLGDIDAIAVDSDGTGTDYHAEFIEDSVRETYMTLARAGIRLYVVTNSYNARVDTLRGMYEHSELGMKVITPEMVSGGDNPKKYRKPKSDMLELIQQEVGSRVLMIGDQMMKDVWSANKAGAPSVLLPRRGEGDDPNVRRFQRPVELRLRQRLHLPIEDSDYPEFVTAA
ncbi:MAG: family hydrolase [Candidatus Saccharibacteria bacterium]|nr:family hydrolase [Candidatus Saccharibacteria bacterium]